MKIEEWKFYRTRDGRKVGPVERDFCSGLCDYPWLAQCEGGEVISYTRSGAYVVGGDSDPRDLVAEWVDEPCSAPPPERMTKTKLLETALRTVADRGVPYGGVEDNFARIAHLWNGYLKAKFADGASGDTTVALPQFKPVDVAALMALMKLGRIAGNPSHMDSWVDLAGYSACGAEIAGR